MRMGKVMVMLVCDNCVYRYGGRRAGLRCLKMMEIIGGRKLTEG